MITVASATEHERRERVLEIAGVSSRTWTRVPTYSNEVWLGDDIVVRINANIEQRRLAREAKLVAKVSAAAKYPALVGWGSDAEMEWTITQRVRGISLGHAWPRMSPAHRERAIHELAAAVAALHATPIDCIEGDLGVDEIGRDRALGPLVPSRDVIAYDGHAPHTLPLVRAVALVDKLRSRVGDRALLDAAERLIRDRWGAFQDAIAPREIDRGSDVGLVHRNPRGSDVGIDGDSHNSDVGRVHRNPRGSDVGRVHRNPRGSDVGLDGDSHGSDVGRVHRNPRGSDVGLVGDSHNSDVGLVHGDPHFENFVWDGEHVSAMLDLEWSRSSWIHGDVEILLAVAESPAEFASPDREHEVDPAHYADIPRWLADARPAWFAHPRLLERLELLHVSRSLGHVDDAFEHPAAWRRLQAALE